MASVGDAPITIVVADDQRLVRAGLRIILDNEPDLTVVADVANGREAIEAVRLHGPDIALLDVQMPVLDGLEAARHIVASGPTRVLMLTTFDDDDYIFRALQAGASGFLLKDAPPDRLADAVRTIVAGDALIDPSVTRRLIGVFTRALRPTSGIPAQLRELTSRELEVFGFLAKGMSNGEIAASLVVEESTVKSHVGRILTKLRLRDRVQAVVLAYESGFATAVGEKPPDARSMERPKMAGQ